MIQDLIWKNNNGYTNHCQLHVKANMQDLLRHYKMSYSV
jgi:hypothetical protein